MSTRHFDNSTIVEAFATGWVLFWSMFLFGAFVSMATKASPQEVPMPPALTAHVESTKEPVLLTKKIVVVVDGSGSMWSHFDEAVRVATGLASQASDEYEINVVLFGDTAMTWPFGWVKMPDLENSRKVMVWLSTWKDTPWATTRADLGMATAYKLGPPEEVSVILVTDGEFMGHTPAQPQKGRVVAMVQVGSSRSPKDFVEFGKACRAGFYTLGKGAE